MATTGIDSAKNILEEGVSARKDQRSLGPVFHFVIVLLKIGLFPIIWIFRELGRMWRFLGCGRANKSKPLSYQEIAFVESMPFFMIASGLLIASIIGGFAW